ncbi:MAG: F0F1 ATP synthase subunit epsilon [Proteobacteria bacterium]|nr:F0F1 ATP synthase subunit epsilon [Pseudomonadota bacterium]
MFKVTLITPTGILMEEDAFMCVLPGEEGALGVLENHIPMIVALKKGRLDLYKTSSEIMRQYDIEKGYAQINKESCFVYTESGKSVG